LLDVHAIGGAAWAGAMSAGCSTQSGHILGEMDHSISFSNAKIDAISLE
jgi:hypothetical protein